MQAAHNSKLIRSHYCQQAIIQSFFIIRGTQVTLPEDNFNPMRIRANRQSEKRKRLAPTSIFPSINNLRVGRAGSFNSRACVYRRDGLLWKHMPLVIDTSYSTGPNCGYGPHALTCTVEIPAQLGSFQIPSASAPTALPR